MRYYLLPEQHGYKILKVQEEDVTLFQRRYGADIVCEAETLGELLAQFAVIVEQATRSG